METVSWKAGTVKEGLPQHGSRPGDRLGWRAQQSRKPGCSISTSSVETGGRLRIWEQVLVGWDVVGELWKFRDGLHFLSDQETRPATESENEGGRVASVRRGGRFEKWSKPNHHLLVYSLQAEDGFCIFNGRKKSKEDFVTHENSMKFKILVSVTKILLELSHTHLFTYCLAAKAVEQLQQMPYIACKVWNIYYQEKFFGPWPRPLLLKAWLHTPAASAYLGSCQICRIGSVF